MADDRITENMLAEGQFPTNAWANPFVSDTDATFILRTRQWARKTAAEVGHDPRRWLERLGERGLFEGALDRARSRIRVTFLSLAREAIAGVCGTADSLLAVQTLVAYSLMAARARGDIVDLLAGGRAMAAFALTEPDGGSNLLGMKTSAVRGTDAYHITGQKVLVSQGHSADLLLVFARTMEAGPHSLSSFLVPAHHRGVSTRELASLAPHPLSEITLDDVQVPLDARVGPEGGGFLAALNALTRVRPSVGAAAVSMAETALRAALDRASSRVVFGVPLADNDAIRARLADAATDLEASRLLVYRAAWLIDEGVIEPRICGAPGSMAKLFATERAQSIIDTALQVFGGHGILAGTPVERLYREIRALRLYEGTSEIQRVVIARDLFDGGTGDSGRA